MMIVKIHSQRLQTLDEIPSFLSDAGPLDFKVPSRNDAYHWIEDSLRQSGYKRLGKTDKGLVRDYLIKLSGFSCAHVTRLIHQFRETGKIRDHRGKPANAFVRHYQEYHATSAPAKNRPSRYPMISPDSYIHCTSPWPSSTRRHGTFKSPPPTSSSSLALSLHFTSRVNCQLEWYHGFHR